MILTHFGCFALAGKENSKTLLNNSFHMNTGSPLKIGKLQVEQLHSP